MEHIKKFFSQVQTCAQEIDYHRIQELVNHLDQLRTRQGRLFILGVGGSAANASHAVNDFRKLCRIESYAPTDNVSELTARTNDEGWETVFLSWLITSRANANDAVLVLSVGGGNKEKNISVNLIHALEESKNRGLKIFAILGKSDGYAAQVADVSVIIPNFDQTLVTPQSEAFQAVVWHCVVSHPTLQVNDTKW